MKCVSTALLILSGLVIAGCQNAEEPSSPGPAPEAAAPVAAAPAPQAPAAEPEGPQTTNQASLLSDPTWAVLFGGQDLSSFNPLGEAQWNIVDDYVEADGYVGSWLVTKGHYTDFHLQVDFWPSEGANSGIFIRNQDAMAISATAGYEINIFDTNENPDNRTGSVVNHSPPMAPVMSDGKWNTYEITAQGSRILVRLNGTVTADVDNDEHASGPIAFQNNGGLIRFRNIRIRPL